MASSDDSLISKEPTVLGLAAWILIALLVLVALRLFFGDIHVSAGAGVR